MLRYGLANIKGESSDLYINCIFETAHGALEGAVISDQRCHLSQCQVELKITSLTMKIILGYEVRGK